MPELKKATRADINELRSAIRGSFRQEAESPSDIKSLRYIDTLVDRIRAFAPEEIKEQKSDILETKFQTDYLRRLEFYTLTGELEEPDPTYSIGNESHSETVMAVALKPLFSQD